MEELKALTVFAFRGSDLRVKMIDGNPWFVVADACRVLELGNVSRVIDRLDPDGVTQSKVIDSLGREQDTAIANEPNLYRLIFRSDKPEAKAFQDWVYNDVLPSIRKTGTYTAPIQQPILPPLPPPLFRGDEAYHAEPICPCPTLEQVEVAIIKTVQWLQPYRSKGVDWYDLRRYSAEIQSYQRVHVAGTLLAIAEKLVERNILIRSVGADGGYYYVIAPLTGYLQSPEQGV